MVRGNTIKFSSHKNIRTCKEIVLEKEIKNLEGKGNNSNIILNIDKSKFRGEKHWNSR